MPKLYKGSKPTLKVPSFDLCWVDGGSEGPVVLCPGGGGQVKSGVVNQIQVVVPPQEDAEDFMSYDLYRGFETDCEDGPEEEKVNGFNYGINTGTLSDGTVVVCTLIQNKALVLKVHPTSDVIREANRQEEALATGKKKRDFLQEALSFDRIATFQADFAEESSAVKCCCFVTAASVECDEADSGVCVRKTIDLLVTGGEDGVLRVWVISSDSNGSSSSSGSKYSVKLLKSLAGHKGQITNLRAYNNPEVKNSNPMHAYVCSSSRDGSVKVWNMSAVIDRDRGREVVLPDGGLLVDIPALGSDLLSGLSGSGSKATEMATSTKKEQCRACVFAAGNDDPSLEVDVDVDGDKSEGQDPKALNVGCYMYTLQTGIRGPCHLVKWELKPQKGASSHRFHGPVQVEAIPLCVTLASKTPCIRLDVSDCGLFVAVGGGDGTATVFSTQSSGKPLSKLHTFACHSYPVTGMKFAPSIIANRAKAPGLLVSCGADNHLCVMPVGGSSTVLNMLMNFLFVIIIVLLSVIAMSLFGGEIFGSIAIF